jgi:thymidylate synthase (FAD)
MNPQVEIVSFTDNIEKHIAYCARVSNPKNQNNESFDGLLRYCIKNQHWSVFEHGFITLGIKTSRVISRQLLRHRSFTFQEFSLRYSEAIQDFQIFQARSQDVKNRQNSIDDLSDDIKMEFYQLQQDNFKICWDNYQRALEIGVAKEQARCLLPESVQTTIYMTGSVRSWIHFIQLRSGNGTQFECQIIALKAHEELLKIAPSIFSLI